jgi:hypothetical protein
MERLLPGEVAGSGQKKGRKKRKNEGEKEAGWNAESGESGDDWLT